MSDRGRGLRLRGRQRDRECEAEIEERRREGTSGACVSSLICVAREKSDAAGGKTKRHGD